MTEEFEKNFPKVLPKELHKYAWKHIRKLSENPYIGKPLGYSFIRELKIDKFRIYFIIYKNEVRILLADVSDKKHQQEVIDFIHRNRDVFYSYIKNLKEDEFI